MKRYIALYTIFMLFVLFAIPDRGTAKETKQAFHYRDKAVVLMYHNFGPVENNVTISDKKFRSQLQALRDAGYHFITMNDFLMYKLHGNDLPNNAVLVTIDDGYESAYKVAFPVLKEFGVKASVFVVVRSTDEPLQHQESETHLSWDEMREMKGNGQSFYSHSYGSHVQVPTDGDGTKKPALIGRLYDKDSKKTETDEQYRRRVATDLELADVRLNAELGNKTRLLCFPYGSYDDELLEIGQKEGIQLFFTTRSGINENDGSLLVKRVNAGASGISERDLLRKLSAYDQPRT
ncbi:polysaccharide deacetylase family protein [Cohnella candidum]|uniref:Polysaccharide deacetylase n=1 Tax=Cohnella candidum TaxID=2674991 RepID=A0A3G3K0K4_9BACL|nr:polysaccharide deacetylase family protein [Cohnella candidum]AYQ74055.1 polysaccharide deacetylase [Cohnella candidum]